MLKSKKGITLVELTIIMAVTSVVITMACGFIVTYRNQSIRIERNSTTVSDVNKFKNAVNEWISTYDSKKYNYSLEDENVQGQTSAKQIDVNSENPKMLYVDQNIIQFDASNKSLYTKTGNTVNKTVEFETITNCVFSKNNGMLYCTLTCNGKQVKLIFNIFSNSKRSRFSNVTGQS